MRQKRLKLSEITFDARKFNLEAVARVSRFIDEIVERDLLERICKSLYCVRVAKLDTRYIALDEALLLRELSRRFQDLKLTFAILNFDDEHELHTVLIDSTITQHLSVTNAFELYAHQKFGVKQFKVAALLRLNRLSYVFGVSTDAITTAIKKMRFQGGKLTVSKNQARPPRASLKNALEANEIFGSELFDDE
ncbi:MULTISPECIES: hypothetical protein [Idiomarina]|jgi:hypothetical protein|uniref:hypothetical protein n=1 Tax=Idiomarina TaxID=135575 RepID=UPI000C0937C1|nr:MULTISPECIES: hypothetical protein [Idiomarina]MAC34258.1 hypothetical protein [Haliea sp.]MAO67416.1 hypothetical protein [Idiomarina sp.]MBF80402.1 hypothetical protein [Idiomarina sp.]MBP59168.1 hypothetical protein [Idiomarina sp.]|tara:strand:- start:21425 stop:22003 length:579 start_codon:yes stop_codon:yes gene_type:complete